MSDMRGKINHSYGKASPQTGKALGISDVAGSLQDYVGVRLGPWVWPSWFPGAASVMGEAVHLFSPIFTAVCFPLSCRVHLISLDCVSKLEETLKGRFCAMEGCAVDRKELT